MVGDGVARLYKSRYDSISSYLHYCKRREENPMHVLEVMATVYQSNACFLFLLMFAVRCQWWSGPEAQAGRRIVKVTIIDERK